ncbi:TAXI family TRAP transporter solute-binding subunit [candidate division KSB1 bacterium]
MKKEIIKFLPVFYFVCFLPVLFGCSNDSQKYRIVSAAEGSTYYNTGKYISDLLRDVNDIDLEELTGIELGSITNCRLLASDSADLAIIQNDTRVDLAFPDSGSFPISEIYSVLPLYPEITYIIYKKGTNPKSLKDLITGRRIGMGPSDSGTARLMREIFSHFGIASSDYTPIYTDFYNNVLSDTIDVCCRVTGFDNKRIEKMLVEGGKLFSLGDSELAGRGSIVDGFCMKYPAAKPFIISKRMYGSEPETPVLTLAVDAVLITRKDMDNDRIYEIIKTILENKHFLTSKDPLFGALTEQFNYYNLTFPLHEGAKMYLERNEPSFIERYAELTGVFLTGVIALCGGVFALYERGKRRKKDKIDRYYMEVISVEKQTDNIVSIEEFQEVIRKVKELRVHAIEQLIAEKLSADESFRIFLTLTNDVINNISLKIKDRSYNKSDKLQV